MDGLTAAHIREELVEMRPEMKLYVLFQLQAQEQFAISRKGVNIVRHF
jgi:hypothetical protein